MGVIKSDKKIKLVFYGSIFGSILITEWTPNLHNSDLMETSYFMADMNSE